MKEISGSYQGQGLSFGIVVSQFNELITQKLLEGALNGLRKHGTDPDLSTVVWVPGAFEIPVIAKKLAETGKYHAVITLGAVIKGSTPHFDYVAAQVASGVSSAALETGIPIIFGVITTESIEQAFERAGSKMGNKGFEAAQSAIEMAHIMHQISAHSPKRSQVCEI